MSRIRGPLPYSEEAEASLLGAALLNTTALTILATQLVPEDFYVKRHLLIAAHLIRAHEQRRPVDVVSLADEIDRYGELVEIGGPAMLTTLQANCPAPSNAAHWARIVLDYSTRRSFVGGAEDLLIQARNPALGMDQIIDYARQRFSGIDLPILAGQADPNIGTFLDGPEDHDWLVPEFFERKDRMIITGTEGAGKSYWCRQIAVSFAAGINPFRLNNPIQPIRVLILDCENSEKQCRRALRHFFNLACGECLDRGWTTPDPDNLRICIKTDGLDLMQRSDQVWLAERCEANTPDLLVIGPLYKLHAGDPTEEGPARVVSRTLDILRHRYNLALLMEAHSPYGSADGRRIIRPYGASLWSRWPEFGYGLVQDRDAEEKFTFTPWRGARDDRKWPKQLMKGGRWPWSMMEDPHGFDDGPPPSPPPYRRSVDPRRSHEGGDPFPPGPSLRMIHGGADSGPPVEDPGF